VPTVVLVTAGFEAVARASAAARCIPDLPIVVFPVDFDEWDAPAVRDAFAARWPAVLRGLQRC
jgi:hypothetical protein